MKKVVHTINLFVLLLLNALPSLSGMVQYVYDSSDRNWPRITCIENEEGDFEYGLKDKGLVAPPKNLTWESFIFDEPGVVALTLDNKLAIRCESPLFQSEDPEDLLETFKYEYRVFDVQDINDSTSWTICGYTIKHNPKYGYSIMGHNCVGDGYCDAPMTYNVLRQRNFSDPLSEVLCDCLQKKDVLATRLHNRLQPTNQVYKESSPAQNAMRRYMLLSYLVTNLRNNENANKAISSSQQSSFASVGFSQEPSPVKNGSLGSLVKGPELIGIDEQS